VSNWEAVRTAKDKPETINMEPPSTTNPNQPSPYRRFLHAIGLDRAPDTAEDLEQEIHELLEEGEESGLISHQEGKMINSIFEFKDTVAEEIMTPKAELICIADTASIPEVISLINSQGFSRIPVYTESPYQIIGIIHAKDLLAITPEDTQTKTARSLAKPAHFVLENQKIVELLRKFQAQKIHLAMVTDEFGSLRGLITLEDILEELVGEISDEYDTHELQWQVINEKTILATARINLAEIEQHFNVTLPEGPYDSVGGLIIHQLGRVPANGTSIEINGLLFHIVASTKRRVITVKIEKKDE
jgi:CBS domain containing-hemolysin-like protein